MNKNEATIDLQKQGHTNVSHTVFKNFFRRHSPKKIISIYFENFCRKLKCISTPWSNKSSFGSKKQDFLFSGKMLLRAWNWAVRSFVFFRFMTGRKRQEVLSMYKSRFLNSIFSTTTSLSSSIKRRNKQYLTAWEALKNNWCWSLSRNQGINLDCAIKQ